METYQQKIFSLEDLTLTSIPFEPSLFFVFASPDFKEIKALTKKLNTSYQSATIIGCSTAGEIMGDQIFDNSVVITAVKFDKTVIKTIDVDLNAQNIDSFKAGATISKHLREDTLKHIFVLSEGLAIDGAALVKGLSSELDSSVSITGGLAGDGSNFNSTYIIHNEEVKNNHVLALGLYGDSLKVAYGSNGGWESFGIERMVTKAEGNILYELDGKPALALYKEYLGDQAKDLPTSGLLYPLSFRNEDNKRAVTRTLFEINEETQSLTFTGCIPEGAYARLTRANVNQLINGAEKSAKITKGESNYSHELAILISCVGRRLVMKQLAEEELEAINDIFDNTIVSTGFYSYGEIGPFDTSTGCSLHNQTMTITTFSE